MKIVFKMILTGILSILFLEVLIAVFVVFGIINVSTVSENDFLHLIFSIDVGETGNTLKFNPMFEIGVATLTALGVLFLEKKPRSSSERID